MLYNWYSETNFWGFLKWIFSFSCVSGCLRTMFSECCYADQQLIFHNRKPSLVQLITIIHICLSCKFFTAWNDKYFVTIVLWSILKIALVHSLYSRIIKSFVSLLMFGNVFNFSQDKNQSHFKKNPKNPFYSAVTYSMRIWVLLRENSFLHDS